MILVALIKQELNSKQLYSNFERLDSLDKDSSLLFQLTILNTDSKAKTLQITDIVNQINQASDDVNDKLERLNTDSKVKTLQIKSIKNIMNQTSDELVSLHLNVTSLNSQSEKLLHDLISQSRTDVQDKLDNLNDIFGMASENKTAQINHILTQIKRTSEDLGNLHLKIGNITSSLNKLDEIKQHLLEETEKIIFKFKNISFLFS